MPDPTRIRFDIELSRVIELLARQIYQSPLALLRENAQNAYDAILIRLHHSNGFVPRIEIAIDPNEIQVRDNGIGMTSDDLRRHFWRAGSSSKNTDSARAAGVVGTFGIGAMANFGIAEELIVRTESAKTGERTFSRAQRSALSVTEECIELRSEPSLAEPGTSIVAKIAPSHSVNVNEAVKYISSFVRFVAIDVLVNGATVSRQSLAQSVQRPAEAWSMRGTQVELSRRLTADYEMVAALGTGEIWIRLENVSLEGTSLSGTLALRQGLSALRTYRSGFGLATASVSSVYQFGGAADFMFLQPTAGREALEAASLQTLQLIMADVDSFCSVQLARHPESNLNTAFMNWVVKTGHYELCQWLRVRTQPGDGQLLRDLVAISASSPVPLQTYSGNDPAVIRMYSSEDRPLLVIAQANPRRQCELEFLRRFCRTEPVSDNPRVLDVKPSTTWSMSESALAFRMTTILETDYFVRVRIEFGQMTHSLPILVTQAADHIVMTLDPASSTTSVILSVYETDYQAFGSLVKDFIRNTIFPKIADYVPSSTRQGAEAFLKTIRRPRDVFEYESSDLADLPSIWQDVIEGKISVERATELSLASARSSVQVVDFSAATTVSEVMPDVVQNESTIQSTSVADDPLGPVPAVTRLDRSTPAKLLTIPDSEEPLRGYRCFLAVTERVRNEHGSFFLQPHKTSVVWGGQRALFIFQHHSGRFGLYYDIQSSSLIASESGGGAFATYTIMLGNAIFIPIPEPIRNSFVPREGERKRFEIRSDVLYIGTGTGDESALV